MAQIEGADQLTRSGGIPLTLGGMLGVGVFLAPAPAAAAAGGWMFLGLMIAAITAGCCALPTALRGASFRGPGAAYVRTRERMGVVPGRVAASAYLASQAAAMGAIGGAIGQFLLPGSASPVGAVAILLVVLAATADVRVRGGAAWMWLILTLAVLATMIAVAFAINPEPLPSAPAMGSAAGITSAAAALFIAFLGFERVTGPNVVGDQVDTRAVCRTVIIAVGATTVIVGFLSGALLYQLGTARLALSPVPVLDALAAADASGLRPLVGAGAAAALLPVLLGALESFRATAVEVVADRDLPTALRRTGSSGTPYLLDLLGGLAAVAVAFLVNPITAALVASCCALVHYALANAAARLFLTDQAKWPWWVSCLGMALSVVLAMSMPVTAMLATLGVVIAGPLIMGAVSGRWS